MTRALALLAALALGGCALRPHEMIPDGPAAVTAAIKLCNWEASPHLHAELKGDQWHVWDDRGNAQAFLNRYDNERTYICVGL